MQRNEWNVREESCDIYTIWLCFCLGAFAHWEIDSFLLWQVQKWNFNMQNSFDREETVKIDKQSKTNQIYNQSGGWKLTNLLWLNNSVVSALFSSRPFLAVRVWKALANFRHEK